MKTVKEIIIERLNLNDHEKIIIEYLEDNDYDGLCNEYCGCGIDDFAPCGDILWDCIPAKKMIVENDDGEFEKGDTIYVSAEDEIK